MKNAAAAMVLGVAGAAMAPAEAAAAQGLVFDRGLPEINLNNASGFDRSNVAWGYGQSSGVNFASGDDFVLPTTGDAGNPVWQVDTIRTWIIAGDPADASFSLSQRYLDAQLYIGTGGGPVSLAQSGTFTGGNTLDNADIVVTPVQYNSSPAQDYQGSSGAAIQIWQVDFMNLGLVVNPGELVEFYSFGNAVDPATGFWFNHASNAALSGTQQDGADDLFRFLQTTALNNTGTLDSNGSGWDKSSDINVQVFATAIPSPSAAALLALAGVGAARRRDRG